VSLGDIVTVVAQSDEPDTESADPRVVQRRFRIVGFLNSGFYEFDAQLAYCDLRVAQDLFGFRDRVYGIGVRIQDIYRPTASAPRWTRRSGSASTPTTGCTCSETCSHGWRRSAS
jgi:lipoprotein-releasing system permease protein